MNATATITHHPTPFAAVAGAVVAAAATFAIGSTVWSHGATTSPSEGTVSVSTPFSHHFQGHTGGRAYVGP